MTAEISYRKTSAKSK